MLDAGYWMLDTGYLILDKKSSIQYQASSIFNQKLQVSLGGVMECWNLLLQGITSDIIPKLRHSNIPAVSFA